MKHPVIAEVPYTFGDNIDDADDTYLLNLARHLRMLAATAQSIVVARDLRMTGSIDNALKVERLRESYITRLPPSWRW